MIREKIEDAAMRLNELAGRVDEETWAMVKAVLNELFDAAEQAMHLEVCTEIPASVVLVGTKEKHDVQQ